MRVCSTFLARICLCGSINNKHNHYDSNVNINNDMLRKVLWAVFWLRHSMPFMWRLSNEDFACGSLCAFLPSIIRPLITAVWVLESLVGNFSLEDMDALIGRLGWDRDPRDAVLRASKVFCWIAVRLFCCLWGYMRVYLWGWMPYLLRLSSGVEVLLIGTK